jgi:hypothetical protein
MPHVPRAEGRAPRGRRRRRPGRARGRARRRRARPRRHPLRGAAEPGRPDRLAAEPAPARADRHRRLAPGACEAPASSSASTPWPSRRRAGEVARRGRRRHRRPARHRHPRDRQRAGRLDLGHPLRRRRPPGSVLLFDDNGATPACRPPSCIAEAARGSRSSRPSASSRPRSAASTTRLCPLLPAPRRPHHHQPAPARAERDGNRLRRRSAATTADLVETREVDQVVVEHGTLPLDDLYFELKPLRANRRRGRLRGPPRRPAAGTLRPNPEGRFRLYRIGDAVASRNIHAAIYDAQAGSPEPRSPVDLDAHHVARGQVLRRLEADARLPPACPSR